MRIVVIEDEAPIREGLEKIISKINKKYVVVGTAVNGAEGLQMIRELEPDLVLMDIRMPEMDGLTMLKKVRELGILCKAIILTAYSEFSYAQQAINLGIEGYLLKPLRVNELSTILDNVEKKIEEERDTYISMDTVLMKGLMGYLEITEDLKLKLIHQHNLHLDQPVYLFVTYLGDAFEEYQDTVKEMLVGFRLKAHQMFYSHIIKIAGHQEILVLIYGLEDPKALRKEIEMRAIPRLLEQLPGLIFAWKEAPNMEKMHLFMKQLDEKLDWNLIFGPKVLITVDKIGEVHTVPIVYPKDLENRAKQALINRQPVSFRECVTELCGGFQKELHRPKDIKEACIRFCTALLSVAQKYGYQPELLEQSVMQNIANATSWVEINEGIYRLFHNILASHQEAAGAGNPLIQRAMEMIRQEYRYGLTLEELSKKLFVSEEYLSGQFKKTTGKTFTETIRKIRLEKVKDLLVHSNLKLNQISYMVGISDPKYMSKMFREEYGILPAEYRKMHTKGK